MLKNIKYFFFFLAFIEGGAVMCVELCSAKILSPYFGTSIYVWAAVLGITLTALMSGYYLGGSISAKNQKKETIFWIMLFAGCFVSLTPIISDFVLPITINLNLLIGTVISLFCFLFFPLMLFGAVSPLIINLLTNQAKESGKSSGNVYAISTLGGIVTTFTVGFYTLPQFGITATLYTYGLLVVFSAIVIAGLTRNLNKKVTGQARNDGGFKVMFLFLTVVLLSFNFQHRFNSNEIIYQSDGILGEVKVVDRNLYNYKSKTYSPFRELMVNNISQTIMDKNNPSKSYWNYVDLLTANIKSFAKGDKTLLLGLGGGTLYKQLDRIKLDVDVVEIDQRIEKLAKNYFDIDKNLNIVIDDARHFINTTQKKYDVIIYDLYHSETPPVHLMTKEAFDEINHRLNKDGLLIINFYGFISGKKGKAARSIYKTLLEDNYHVKLIATPGIEKNRNLLFIAGKKKLNTISDTLYQEIIKADIDLNDAVVLTDDKPILEHIYLEAALAWRKDYNEVNAKYFLK